MKTPPIPFLVVSIQTCYTYERYGKQFRRESIRNDGRVR
jgi:hypothetical protein